MNWMKQRALRQLLFINPQSDRSNAIHCPIPFSMFA